MSDFEELPMGDVRERALKESEYLVQSVGVGKVICSRPGVKLIDFYRTSAVLAKDVVENKGE